MVDRIESSKDIVQEVVESTATHVGRIATIITTAVADVAREIGEIVTDGFEMRDAARQARLDDQRMAGQAGGLDADGFEDAGIDDAGPDEGFDDDLPGADHGLEAAGEQPALPSGAGRPELEQDSELEQD